MREKATYSPHTACVQHALRQNKGRTKGKEWAKKIGRRKSIATSNHEKLHPPVPLMLFFCTFHTFSTMVRQLRKSVPLSHQPIGSNPFTYQVSNGRVCPALCELHVVRMGTPRICMCTQLDPHTRVAVQECRNFI